MSNLKAIHSAVRMPPVNKIMVVGHPLSGHEAVTHMLHLCGLQTAVASKAQGMSPSQVTEMLLRAYRVPPLNALQDLGRLAPIAPSPVWQTLALDLLLGNLEQELWGWSDPQAIYLLDYWKQLDQQMAFVLVYESPQDTLARLVEQAEDCSQAMVEDAMGNWLAYNEALLNFYLGNTERCLLVHSAQASSQTQECLAQMKHHIGVSLTLSDTDRTNQPPSAMHETRAYLTKAVLAANSKANSLYDDMQSVATLPQGQDKDKDGPLTALRALQSFVRMHRANLQIQTALDELKANARAQEQAMTQLKTAEHMAQSQVEGLQTQVQQLRQQEVALQQQLAEMAQRGNQLQARADELAGQVQQAREEAKQEAAAVAADYVAGNKALEEENQMLLEELHKVQEELEQFYLESKQENEKNRFIVNSNISAETSKLEKLYEIKIIYKLGSTVLNSRKSISDLIKLPARLIKIKKLSKNNAYIESMYIGEFNEGDYERIKKHLSYRYGEIIINIFNKPRLIFVFPLLLFRAYKNWYKNKIEMK